VSGSWYRVWPGVSQARANSVSKGDSPVAPGRHFARLTASEPDAEQLALTLTACSAKRRARHVALHSAVGAAPGQGGAALPVFSPLLMRLGG